MHRPPSALARFLGFSDGSSSWHSRWSAVRASRVARSLAPLPANVCEANAPDSKIARTWFVAGGGTRAGWSIVTSAAQLHAAPDAAPLVATSRALYFPACGSAPLSSGPLDRSGMPDTILAREHALLLASLHRSGLEVASIQEWINGRTPLDAAPILIEHLEGCTSEDLKDALARALTQREFKAAIPALLRQFALVVNDDVRWAIGQAIAVLGFPKPFWPEILRLASSREYGRGRQNLVWRLHRIRLPEVERIWMGLVSDQDVDAFAVMALGYCGSHESYEFLRALDTSARTVLVRREVPKAVKRLAKRLPQRPN
jgi:hypothetical protein